LQETQSSSGAPEEDYLARLEKLSEKVWEKELFNSPFLLDLFDGRLPRKNFAGYLVQDYHYLGGLARAMAMATARSEDLFAMKVFGVHLKITLDVEFPRVWKLMTRFGIRNSTIKKLPTLPGTVAYTDFLFDTCSKCSPAEIVAAIYPCNFSYRTIGKKIRIALKKYYNVPESYISFNLYQRRVFTESAQNTLQILSRGTVNASRKHEKKVLDKFYEATKHERRFWDQNLF